MDQGTAAGRLRDGGFGSVQFLLASALALLLFLSLANLVVVQYGRGAVRSALEQGAAAGAKSRSAEMCEVVIADVLGQLLAGSMSKGLSVGCVIAGEQMRAEGSGTFQSWTPFAPDFSFSISTDTVMEPDL